MSSQLYALIVLLPLLTAAVTGIFGKQIGAKGSIAINTSGVLVAMVLSLITFWQVAIQGAPTVDIELYRWIATGSFDVSFGVYIDKLTAVMLMVVTLVSAMVHIYSIGYMSHDDGRGRFFSYLSLFTFTMLALVTAPNLLQLFLGWEGVGLASYLLIGFWFKRDSANAASMKAFVVNRVADVGLLVAILTTFVVVGSLSFGDIFASLPAIQDDVFSFFGFNIPVLELIAFALLIGAMGKSAQFGFHTWLPDAMEGPTPVSALIHAATMVTAGVFLLARMSPLFELTTVALLAVALVGGLTAIFAASIGLTQTDIKRVIAYSTCSQIGYMFFACGVSAYSAAMFHLMTHAYFKALLFLAAGSIIHGIKDEQDLRKMGALRKILPVTYILMWIGSLALVGIPPFAGFFSKDFILESAFMSGTTTGYVLYVVGTFAALLTAFYTFRVLYLAFHGEYRGEPKVYKEAHESGPVMIIPMAVLALGAVVAGFAGMSMMNTDWWMGSIVINDVLHPGASEAHHIPKFFKYLPLLAGLAGIAFATYIYLRTKNGAKRLAAASGWLYRASLNKWYIDELYHVVFVKPTKALGRFFTVYGDEKTIDRFGPDGAALITLRIGQMARKLQTGYIYHYVFVLIVGVVLTLSYLMYIKG